jgi:hypothetical protein
VVKDANNCEKSISIQVTQPTLLTTQTDSLNVLCYGDSTGRVRTIPQGGVGNYTYSWTSSTHPIITTIMPSNLAIVNNLPAGTYIVEVRDDNQCLVIDSTVINQPDTALAISLTQIDNLCFGDSLASIDVTTIGGTAPYIFNWSNNETTEDIDSLAVGTYFLTAKDNNNCLATINTTIVSPTQLAETNVITNVNCFGENNGAIDLAITGGVSPYTYLWNTGATTEDLNAVANGSYSVTVTDANGCQTNISTTMNIVSTVQITVDNVQDEAVQLGGAIDVSVSGGQAPYYFLWNTGLTTASISGLVAGTYTVTVTDINGCSSVQTVVVDYSIPALVENIEAVESLSIFPNPTSDIVNFQLSLNEETEVKLDIFAVNGQLVQSFTSNNAKVQQYSADLSDYPAGIYMARLIIGSEVITAKIVLKK